MWALKNGDLDEVKDYVAKVSGDEWSARRRGGGEAEGADEAGVGGVGGKDILDGGGSEDQGESGELPNGWKSSVRLTAVSVPS